MNSVENPEANATLCFVQCFNSFLFFFSFYVIWLIKITKHFHQLGARSGLVENVSNYEPN